MAFVCMKGIVFVVALALFTPVGVFLLTLLVPLLLLHQALVLVGLTNACGSTVFLRAHHAAANIVAERWCGLVACLLEVVFKIKLKFSYESNETRAAAEKKRWVFVGKLSSIIAPPSRPGAVNIIISNHPSRIDWMLLWLLMARTEALSTMKIALKKGLKAVPLFGWAVQHLRFLFLSRSWSEDERNIQTVLRHFVDTDDRATLLIFPEGTDLSPSNLQKSHAFAQERGLPKFKFVLNPRTKGMVAIRNAIGESNIESIYDLTLGYTQHPQLEGSYVRAEGTLLDGRTPQCLHVFCRRFAFGPGSPSVEALPPGMTDDQFAAWVEERFKEKEERLQKFYEKKSPDYTEAVGFEGCCVGAAHSTPDAEQPPTLWYHGVVWWWGMSTVVIVMLLRMLLSLQHTLYFLAFLCGFNLVLTQFFGGVEPLWMHRRGQRQQPGKNDHPQHTKQT